MYLFFTFTGGRGRFDRRERGRASATCRRWWYLRGGDGVIYLGILERGHFFFFFFLSLVADWLERMGMKLVFLCKIETCNILYREKKLVVREEEEER